jgi:hypothetical protein
MLGTAMGAPLNGVGMGATPSSEIPGSAKARASSFKHLLTVS